jgi:hypothetical protein
VYCSRVPAVLVAQQDNNVNNRLVIRARINIIIICCQSVCPQDGELILKLRGSKGVEDSVLKGATHIQYVVTGWCKIVIWGNNPQH